MKNKADSAESLLENLDTNKSANEKEGGIVADKKLLESEEEKRKQIEAGSEEEKKKDPSGDELAKELDKRF